MKRWILVSLAVLLTAVLAPAPASAKVNVVSTLQDFASIAQ